MMGFGFSVSYFPCQRLFSSWYWQDKKILASLLTVVAEAENKWPGPHILALVSTFSFLKIIIIFFSRQGTWLRKKDNVFFIEMGATKGGGTPKFIYLESSHQPVSSVPVAVDVSCLLPMLVVAHRGSRKMVAVFAFLDKSWHVARAPSWLEAVTAPIVDVVITYLKQQTVEAVFCFFTPFCKLQLHGVPKKLLTILGD